MSEICLRCGTRENLELFAHKKTFVLSGGRSFGYFIPSQFNTVQVAVCGDCHKKFRLFKKLSPIFSLLNLLNLILLALAVYFLRDFNVLNLIAEISLFFFFFLLTFSIVLLSSNYRPKNFVKIGVGDFIPYVRPVNSKKWVLYKYWRQFTAEHPDLALVSKNLKKSIKSSIIYLGLLGALLCVFSTIFPIFTSLGATWIWGALIGVILYIRYPYMVTLSPEAPLLIFFLILIIVFSYIVSKNMSLLFKAKFSIKSVEIKILIYSILLLLLGIFFLTRSSWGIPLGPLALVIGASLLIVTIIGIKIIK